MKHSDSIVFQLKTTKGQPSGRPFVISLILEKKTGHTARPPEAVLGWWVGIGLFGLPLLAGRLCPGIETMFPVQEEVERPGFSRVRRGVRSPRRTRKKPCCG
jgi:hypothetical protein